MSEPGPVRRLASLTTEEAAGVLREGTALLLPVGSTEAHGPHLPLETDRIIAEETVRRAALRLESRGIPALLLPALAYARAVSAAPFAGTVCLSPGSMRPWLEDLARSLAPPGGALLCLVNASAMASLEENSRYTVPTPMPASLAMSATVVLA